MKLDLPLPLNITLAVFVAVAPAATILLFGHKLKGLAKKILSFGEEVAPALPGLVKLDEYLFGMNALTVIVGAPYIVAICLGQFYLTEKSAIPIFIGVIVGLFVCLPFAYGFLRKVGAEERPSSGE